MTHIIIFMCGKDTVHEPVLFPLSIDQESNTNKIIDAVKWQMMSNDNLLKEAISGCLSVRTGGAYSQSSGAFIPADEVRDVLINGRDIVLTYTDCEDIARDVIMMRAMYDTACKEAAEVAAHG